MARDESEAPPAAGGGAPGPALLQVDKLTLRFRGLTAVSAVDLEVAKGSITAVIGPNGAGKTSLFNAITGIYEPTEGTVRLAGQDLRSEPTRANVLRWAIAGVVIGLALFLWVADVNQLWAAVVKANYHGAERSFELGHAIEDLSAFLSARPRIETRMGRFYVTSFDGSAPFGSARSRDEAENKRAAIPAMASSPADGSAIVEQDGAFAILSADRKQVLDRAPSREAALERLAAARTLDALSESAVRRRLIALVLGLALGMAGAWAVWRQTRRTPASVARRGIARTFQNIRLFQNMSVIENVLVGMDRHLVWTERSPSAARPGEAKRSEGRTEDDGRVVALEQGQHPVWTERSPSAARPGEEKRSEGRTENDGRVVALEQGQHLVQGGRWLSARRLRDVWPIAALAAGYAVVWLAIRFAFLPEALTGLLLAGALLGGVAVVVAIARRGAFSPAGVEIEAVGRSEALALLKFVGLADRSQDLAKNLPYGAQRRLEIARALATRPTLLLLDEPAAGMNPAETRSLMQLIQDIRKRGVTILLIEHHMRVVMGISDRIAVLVYGQKIAEGAPEEIRNNPRVIEAYLGQEQIE
jgi:ABC-type branched-subunit amino acid transport system ATPase component